MKLNIGCGRKQLEDYINIDKHDYGQHVVRDVLKGLPYPNNVIEEIRMHHLIEHFHYEEICDILGECWRVCQPGGKIEVTVPHAGRALHKAFQDPSHKTFFVPGTFPYFEMDHAYSHEFSLKLDSLMENKTEIRAIYRVIK